MTAHLDIADVASEIDGGTSVVHLSALGAARISIGRSVFTPAATRRFALLLYLINERSAPAPRATLLELFLHDLLPRKANHSLRELLYELRRAGIPLASDADGVALAGASVATDYTDIIGSPSLSDAQLETISAGFLPGYAPNLSDGFGDWLAAFRTRTVFGLTQRLVHELRRARSNDDSSATERIARVCLRLDPVHEEATLALAEMLALGGAKAEAIRLLDRYIVDVGGRSTPLSLPASLLKRRIAERLPQRYGVETTLPFVGRDEEMAKLADRLDRARAGESACVVLLGEAGIGKTRIATEFVARSALQGVRFVAATAQPHDTHRPMGAFVDAVPQLLDLPGALGCSPTSMAALRRLTVHDPAAHATTPDYPGQGEEIAVGIARAIGDLVDAITSEAPLILWLEDAHWLDEMSLQMATSLVGGRIARRLLVVLTTRERRQLTGHCAEHATTIVVRPLASEAAHALATGALAGHAVGADASNLQWLLSTAAGNPFFLVSLLNHVERTGERYSIPKTISELLDQRIAALSLEATNVLEACVLLGKHATIERLVAVMELPHFQLLALLKELEDRRMITKSGELIQASHWLIADSVQRASSPIASELSHRRIAELLEAEARETQSPALLWDCGEHWLATGSSAKAVQIIRECSQHAVEIGRAREGAELLQRAARATTGSLHRELLEERVRLAATALEWDVVIAGTEMLRAAGVTGKHDDIEIAELVSNAFRAEDTEEISSRFRNCIDSCESTPEHRVQLGVAVIVYCANHDAPELAHEVFEVMNALIGSHDANRSFHPMQFFLVYHACFGDLEIAAAIANEMLARSDWSLPQQADATRKASVALWFAGRAGDALNALGRGFELASGSGLSKLKFTLAMMTASIHSDLGDTYQSRRWLAIAEAIGDTIPSLRRNFTYLIAKADIASATCDIGELQTIRDAARQIGFPPSNRRIGRWATALEALIDHLNGAEMDSAAAIENLTVNHRKGEPHQFSDFEAAVALKISRKSERKSTTMLRLRRYLALRRPGPLLAMLQQTITDLEQNGRRRSR
jgi:DNA-binding SARP family transcriptional activator